MSANPKFLLIILLSSFWTIAAAQNAVLEVFATAGDFNRNNNFGSLHWTIGEPLTETLSNNNFQLTQGFHQVYYYLTTDADEAYPPTIEAKIYPNPTTERVILETFGIDNFIVDIRNVTGQLLLQETGNFNKLELDFSAYPAGVHILTIISPDGLSRSFKVQKLQF